MSDPPTSAETDELNTLKDDLATKAGHLPANTDKAIIQEVVKNSEDFQKYKINNIDSKVLTTKCEADANPNFETCTPTANIADITKQYLNKEEAYDKVKAKEDQFANSVKSIQGRVDAHNFSSIATCDATAGLVYKEYDTADCKGTAKKEFKAAWGACVQGPDAKTFIKVTGASALQAAAVALVAFAGSQF